MIAFLIAERFVNDLCISWKHTRSQGYGALPGESDLEQQRQRTYVEALSRVLAGEEVRLEPNHKGRVRLSELKQALRTGRIREQYGILWDGRHLETDLQISILDASDSAPLSIGYLDTNGLGNINNNYGGHEAGSAAVRAYFLAVAKALRHQGEAYAIAGDEVIALLPAHDSLSAIHRLRTACLLLMREKVKFHDKELPQLSLSVGVATTSDPTTDFRAMRLLAEQAMNRAKDETRKHEPRPSAIAVGENGEVALINLPNIH
jgi:diguanylate cyclase (GGDEF)-like protein